MKSEGRMKKNKARKKKGRRKKGRRNKKDELDSRNQNLRPETQKS